MKNSGPSNERKAQVEAIFHAALELPSAEEQEIYLRAACAGQPDLQDQVQRLLKGSAAAEAVFQPKPKSWAVTTKTVVLPLAEATGSRIGRYKLLEKIGEGGCGVVYVAEQEEPVRRRVALKVIKLGMDTKSVVARFEAERQALAMMDHPNIAKVLDAGATDTGRPYFVMELVRGIKITDYCDQNKLSTRQRLDLFIQVCRAVQHAHQKGIIHRDLKPSNILVTLHDGVPVPKVIDFGIAKATESRLTELTVYTELHQFIGTPAYMSPEQAEMSGLDIDTRSDIYSLGVLLYELLTGQTPFDPKELLAAGLDEMRRTIREREPMRPSTRLTQALVAVSRESAADPAGLECGALTRRRYNEIQELIHLLRGDLDWIVMKCLEKDRTRRYETANGLAMDIQRHLHSEPVVARPPSSAYRVQKFVRRNRVAVTAALSVVAVLVLGIFASTWQAVRATRAEREQSRSRHEAEQAQAIATTEAAKARQAAEAQRRERTAAQRNLYVANMNLAQQAWEENNIARLRQLLEETTTYPDRGFEWYYWQQQLHLELKTLRGHLGFVNTAAFSPDGQRIVTGGVDETARVWATDSGQQLLALKGHAAPIWSAAFSPDGQRIVTGSYDQTAKVWAAATGKELLTLKGHTAQLSSVAFSRDGQRIATTSVDGRVRVCEAASGKELLTIKGRARWFMGVAFSPDGQRIVTGTGGETAEVWDAASGNELLSLAGHAAPITSVAFSLDGQRIVTGGRDNTARVWEAATGKELLTLRGHSAQLWAAAFAPDGQRIVTGSDDRTAKIWDAATGKELRSLKGHTAPILSAAFSPDGQRVVTSSGDGTAKVWDAALSKGLLSFAGHGAAFPVAFSPDGQRVVTVSSDHNAKMWETSSGKELLTLSGHTARLISAAFSLDGQRIVTFGIDQMAKVWETASGRELLTLGGGHTEVILTAAFSPDGRWIVTGSEDKTAKVWNATTGKQSLTLAGHGAEIRSVAFSPDGQRIVTASWDKTAKVWETTTGKELLQLKGHTGLIYSVAFSPDGQRIVTGSDDRTAKVWEAATGKELFALKGHSIWLVSVAFSPDGQRIVTGSADQTAKVWDAVGGKELLTLKGHTQIVHLVSFSPDGQRIFTGSNDHTVRVWEAASAEQVASWRTEEQAAAEALAAQQREWDAAAERDRALRAKDPGVIRRWLVFLPIAFEGENGARALQEEQIMQESQLHPRAGERMKAGRSELVWNAVELKDGVLDFNRLASEMTQWSVAYAVTYIQSEAEQSGLVMKVGSDDEARVYLNGKLIYQSLFERGYIEDENVVAGVELKAGVNVLVFKVANDTGSWQGSVRLTEGDGQPIKGIKVTLTP